MPDSSGGHESLTGGMLAVTIVTPAGSRVDVQARHLRAPGFEGDFGVLPGHIPFLTPLRIGAIMLDLDKGRETWATSGGFVEVLPGKVTILAETAERSDQIDVARAESSRKRAQERIARRDAGDFDLQRANASLARAINRIRVANASGVS